MRVVVVVPVFRRGFSFDWQATLASEEASYNRFELRCGEKCLDIAKVMRLEFHE
jgi:hypothetical protein